MALTRSEIKKAVIKALKIVSGEELDGLEDDDKPITDLGLKSKHGVDFAGEVEIELEIEIDEKINPFIDDEKKRDRTIKEIVDLIENSLNQLS